MNILPLHDRILIKRLGEEEKTNTEIKIKGEEQLIVRGDDILGIVVE